MVIVALLGMLVAWSAFPADAQSTDEREPTLAEGLVPDEIVIGFEGAIPADAASWIEEQGGEVLIVEPKVSWVSASFGSQQEADQAIAAALSRSDVRWAEHDGYVSTMHVPNDPMYGSQWGYPVINAPQAWDTQQGSHDVSVAILDTGTEGSHPDLAENICGPHAEFVTGSPDPLSPFHFHGTHVAGTVAAVNDNGVGVAGTSQSCIMAGQVLGASGGGQWTWVAAGITWAADNGAHVISMSLGGAGGDISVQEAVAYAYGVQGVLIIASAGNSGCFGGDTVGYPAQYSAVMAVASLDSATSTSGFSSCGPDVEIAAPGSSVLSTWTNGGYGYASGTSMSAPHVAGVAALVMSEHPELSASDVRCALALSSDDILASGVDHQTGWGRLNAERAVALDIDPLTLLQATSNPNALSSCTPEAVNAILSAAG